MKTAIDTIREALLNLRPILAGYYGKATDDDLKQFDDAITSLKSLEGPRLTVDEAMRVADIEEVRKAFGFIKEIGERRPATPNDQTIALHNIVKWANHGLASLPQQDVGAGRSVPSPVGQAQQDSDVLGDAEGGPRAAGVPFAEDGGTGSSLAAPSPAIAPAHKPLICQQCYVPFQSPDHGGMAWLHDRQNTIDPDGPCECKCHGLFADTLSNQ